MKRGSMAATDIPFNLLTNHARVLLALSQDPTMRVRTIAEEIAITERAVHKILRDLEKSAFIERRRDGRRNSYLLHLDRPIPGTTGITPTVSQLLGSITGHIGRSAAVCITTSVLRPRTANSTRQDEGIEAYQQILSEARASLPGSRLVVLLCEDEHPDRSASASELFRQACEREMVPLRRYRDRPDSAEAVLLEIQQDLQLDLSRSFVVSDHPLLMDRSEQFGLTGLYVLTDEGSRLLESVPMHQALFHTLNTALRWITGHPEGVASLERTIAEGVEAIRNGGLTVFPTETVYGLGADAMNAEAVRKIFAAKNRPFQDPLISHVSSREMVYPMVSEVSEQAEALMDAFWPGPLTLVFPRSDRVPDVVTAGNPTVAIRMPAHRLALELIRRAGTPIAAPSANSFGRTSPTTAQHVEDQLAGRFDAIIDGGACRVGVESTVLSLIGTTPVLLRPGGVTIEQIEAVIGPILVKAPGVPVHFDSPGLFPSHYAPKTPMIMVDDPSLYAHEQHIAVMLFEPSAVPYEGMTFVLSPDGDPRGAAARLYDTMRTIDTFGLRLIVAQRLPQTGVGIAVNDRMHRASVKG
jgi:L-threonylcarbamoyladenylate synthase